MATAKPARYTVAQALAIVFGTPPLGRGHTTAHIQSVLGKLLGRNLTEADTLAALHAAEYATLRPGNDGRPRKWHFQRAPSSNPR